MTTISNKQKQESDAGAWRAARAAFTASSLTLVAVALAIAGHMVTAQRNHVVWGAILFALGLALFFLSPLHAAGLASDQGKGGVAEAKLFIPLVRSSRWRMALLVNSVALAAAAYWAFEGNRLDRGFWLWVSAGGYFVAAVVEWPAPGLRLALAAWRRSWNWRVAGILFAITVLAVFMRVFRLAAVPVEMTSDHAEKLLDVYDVLGGLRPIYFPRNTGREAFQFYLTAALIAWTPLQLGHLALKVGTALFGILTVPASYLLGKALFGRRVGLLAAFLLAVSHWHVTIGRVGLRFPFTAAFTAPALFFLLRALRKNRRNDWLAAGLLLGAGLHTYTAMRIVPLLFVLLVAIRVASDLAAYARSAGARRAVSGPRLTALELSFWKNAFVGGCGALLVFLPLLRIMMDNPEGFWYRAASRAQEVGSPAEVWGTFWFNVKNALLMFNYRGDVVPMNTVPEAAVLDPATGGLFVLGMAYVLWRLLGRRERAMGYVVVSFVTLLLPSILSLAYPGENPSVVRTGGVIPIVMIIAALPLALLTKGVEESRGRWERGLTSLFLLVLLAGAASYNYNWYFKHYDENIRRSLWNATELAAELREFEASGGQLENAYHVAYPHWVDTRNIAINAGNITWHNAVTDLAQIEAQAQFAGRKLYLVHPSDGPALEALQSAYPQGVARLHPSARPGKQFVVFEAPAPKSRTER